MTKWKQLIRLIHRRTLPEILEFLTDYAVDNGLCGLVTERDLFDTKLMGVVTPGRPDVNREFRTIYETEGSEGCDGLVLSVLSGHELYPPRTLRDLRWKTETEFGNFDITINLSKPGKGSASHRGCWQEKIDELSDVPAVPGKRRVRGKNGSSARENHRDHRSRWAANTGICSIRPTSTTTNTASS